MNRDQLKSILREIGLSSGKNPNYKDSGDNVQFCCPFHGELRPSTGISIYNLTGHCFACDEDYNLPKLVAHCLEFSNTYRTVGGGKETVYDYTQANNWLDERVHIDKKKIDIKNGAINRIEDNVDNNGDNVDNLVRFEQPLVRIAPFQSGKATHDYFFERGFTKETAKKFKVGWDSNRKRVTVPVFWQDGALCGVIGRAVLEMRLPNGDPNPEFYKVYKEETKNDVKYYIYDTFPVGDILFPLPQFKLIDDTAIIVEGQYDCMWMHQNEFSNTLSSLGSKLVWSKRLQMSKQIELLHILGVKKVIMMRDNDEAGIKGCEHDYKLLKGDFVVYGVKYPEGKNDPKDLTKDEIQYMIDHKYVYGAKLTKIKRIE